MRMGQTVKIGWLVMMALVTVPEAYAAEPDAVIDVDVNKPSVAIPATLYGVFYEDINHAADGGLYAELVQNRSFACYPAGKTLREGNRDGNTGSAWSTVERGGGSCTVIVENTQPLNSTNTDYVCMTIQKPGTGVGVANSGFGGIFVRQGATYDFSFYARRIPGSAAPFTIALETESGEVLGQAVINGVSGDWRKHETALTVSNTNEKTRLVVTTTGSGVVCMDMISLFPRITFKGRTNGLRPDLAQAIADLKPGVFRFPGGCIAHGADLANAYRWKETVGDVAERREKQNLWGYWQSFGLGYFEYFQFIEDIGAEPLPVLPVGVSCGFRRFQAVSLDKLQPWIDDALDLVEFANGPATSTWGRVRATMGHPAPFNLKYMCLGNEEHDSPEFRERVPLFVKALRTTHPEIKLIGTSGLGPGIPLYQFMADNKLDLSDEHYYEGPRWFIRHRNRFDSFDRSKPKVFVGEYASGGNALYNALAEAVYLTGIERNADMVAMTAYAPTLARYDYTQWESANLIWFDHKTVVRTPSYHVQHMFSRNRGDRYLPSTISLADKEWTTVSPARGKIGVGTWNTQAEFDDLRVTSDGKTIIAQSFADAPGAAWQVMSGTFAVRNGVYVQKSGSEGAVSLCNQPIGSDRVTYSLKARKLGGSEGFLVVFGHKDSGSFYWWNIGGWGNSQHGIESGSGGFTGPKESLASRSGTIRDGVWYAIRIELAGPRIKCFLDNELIHDVTASSESALAVSATAEAATGDLILKIANTYEADMMAEINLRGVKAVERKASALVMRGAPGALNDLAAPDRILPQAIKVPAAPQFTYTVPASSVQIIRIKTRE